MFLRQARSMLSPPSKNCNQLYSWLQPERDSKEPQDFGLTGNSRVESVATGHSLLQPTLNAIIEKSRDTGLHHTVALTERRGSKRLPNNTVDDVDALWTCQRECLSLANSLATVTAHIQLTKQITLPSFGGHLERTWNKSHGHALYNVSPIMRQY